MFKLLLVCFFAKSQVYHNSDTLSSIRIVYSYPWLLNEHNKLLTIQDTVTLYYNKNFILHELPKVENLNTKSKVIGSESYFLAKKNNFYGVFYTPMDKEKLPKIMNADSFLIKNCMYNSGCDFPINSSYITKKLFKNSKLIMEFTTKKNYGEVLYDSIIYEFDNNYNDVAFTFSKKIDSITNLKLTKIKLIYKPKYSLELKKNLPKRTISFEIQRNFIEKIKETEVNQLIDKLNNYF